MTLKLQEALEFESDTKSVVGAKCATSLNTPSVEMIDLLASVETKDVLFFP
jgi:hypothetical protein